MPGTSEERAAALWSFFYFFTLLAGYYVLRPLRDQMGIAGEVKALPWLFTATFVTLLVAQLRSIGCKVTASPVYPNRLSLLRSQSGNLLGVDNSQCRNGNRGTRVLRLG
jgi:hypothetical protein